jgi:hypothetical protein
MESGAGRILSHHPGVGVAYFFDRIRSQLRNLRIPLRHARIVPSHALADLHQRMLNVPGMLFVLQIFRQLFVGKLAAEPSIPPEQKRH